MTVVEKRDAEATPAAIPRRANSELELFVTTPTRPVVTSASLLPPLRSVDLPRVPVIPPSSALVTLLPALLISLPRMANHARIPPDPDLEVFSALLVCARLEIFSVSL